MKRLILIAAAVSILAGCSLFDKEKDESTIPEDVENGYKPLEGKQVASIDAKSLKGTFTYDAIGRIKTADIILNGKQQDQYIFSYGSDYVALYHNGHETHRAQLDANGRITETDGLTTEYDTDGYLSGGKYTGYDNVETLHVYWDAGNMVGTMLMAYNDVTYTSYLNKTNIDLTAWITNNFFIFEGMVLNIPEQMFGLFGFWGKRSEYLPASEAYLGNARTYYQYVFDADGCPTKITWDETEYIITYM